MRSIRTVTHIYMGPTVSYCRHPVYRSHVCRPLAMSLYRTTRGPDVTLVVDAKLN